ncbi:MAG: serine acetyltransferase [Deltaproteobacteria bacterium]|nr:serine acetyltransferase [Candidatus Anaeroferrophillus wilburensis]MBN2887878.1 serine acetyltransferase [Deltaproteobacteria bacterium]
MNDVSTPEQCINRLEISGQYRQEIPAVVEQLVETCKSGECYEHLAPEPIPSREATIAIIHQTRKILFPGYFTRLRIDPVNIEYYLGQEVSTLHEMLTEQIILAVRHNCLRYHESCSQCEVRGHEAALAFVRELPQLRTMLAEDVRASMEGDPAAQSIDEVIFSYPGLFAITIYRLAHLLRHLDVPLLPRMMTEYAHSKTGIDINPGAHIGDYFFIDHGTGIVIGETTTIGSRVRIYQGVTLGALSLPKDAGISLRNQKRHPTIEDDVIIYSGATILGGETVIGARSVIGGNVWITQSVPPDTKVLLKNPELVHCTNDS